MKKTQTQIKTEKAKKIKIFGFATLGLTMVAGATALALTSCSKPSTETTYTITENKDFKADEPMTAKNPYGGFEITISIKFPDVAKETQETWYELAFTKDHSDIAELKVKFAKGNKISKDEYTKVTSKTSQGGYGFTKTCPYKTKLSGMKSTLNKEESMEFTKALCSTAEAGDSNANNILNEILKNTNLKNTSFKEYYTSEKNPNKLEISLTPAELQLVAKSITNPTTKAKIDSFAKAAKELIVKYEKSQAPKTISNLKK